MKVLEKGMLKPYSRIVLGQRCKLLWRWVGAQLRCMAAKDLLGLVDGACDVALFGQAR